MKYEQKIIAYIDILGFKNYIESTKNDSKKDALYRALIAFKPSSQENIMKHPSRQVAHFSDLLVITIDDNSAYLNDLINDLMTLTNDILNSTSLLLRGIIMKGDILHYNGIMFGPGLIEAYEKEKFLIKYPRIVVDDNLIKNSVSNFSKLTLDEDDKYYIDYLKANSQPSYRFAEERIFGLFKNKNLSEILKSGLVSTDDRIREKYIWIKNRHNKLVEDEVKRFRQQMISYEDEGRIIIREIAASAIE